MRGLTSCFALIASISILYFSLAIHKAHTQNHFFPFLLQELAHVFGGKVAPGLKREYGKASVSRVEGCISPLFAGLPEEFVMWMSHGDKLHEVPDGFKAVGEFVCLLVCI